MLVGPSKWLKQVIQIKLNRVIYKQSREFELRTTVNKSSYSG